MKTLRSRTALLTSVLFLLACGQPEATSAGGRDAGTAPRGSGSTADPGPVTPGTRPPVVPTDAGVPPSGLFDPLWVPTANEPGALHDVSYDLPTLLEHGELEHACARYFQGRTDRRTKLLCGKKMFFDETFGLPGVPAAIPRFLLKNLRDEVGAGFSNLGLIPDPRSEEALPLGMAPSTYDAGPPMLAYTCAGCHFSRLPDGRYAVGAANHQYDYGKHILQMVLFPGLALSGKEETHHPLAVAAVKPLVDRVNESKLLKAKLILALVPLMTSGSGAGKVSVETEGIYASWAPGTLDFLIEPLPTDDGVHTVHRILSLWSIADRGAAEDAGMRHSMLGWSGGTSDVMRYLQLFIAAGVGSADAWPHWKLEPLAAYVLSLRPPSPPHVGAPAQVERGLKLFHEKGCIACHGGPGGSSLRTYLPEEIGTDAAIARYLNPDADGKPCCDMDPKSVDVTRGVKSPRLVGLWSASRLLHNGSVVSLEDLFCKSFVRPTLPEPFGPQGHSQTCENLTPAEADDLIAYLRAR